MYDADIPTKAKALTRRNGSLNVSLDAVELMTVVNPDLNIHLAQMGIFTQLEVVQHSANVAQLRTGIRMNLPSCGQIARITKVSMGHEAPALFMIGRLTIDSVLWVSSATRAACRRPSAPAPVTHRTWRRCNRAVISPTQGRH